MDHVRTLRDARLAAGLTQAELAERAGTSQTAVSAYENGARSPSLETFDRLLAATGNRLAAAPRSRPLRTPSRRDHERAARTLLDVLELAEKLPTRHEPALRYPRLRSRPA